MEEPNDKTVVSRRARVYSFKLYAKKLVMELIAVSQSLGESGHVQILRMIPKYQTLVSLYLWKVNAVHILLNAE